MIVDPIRIPLKSSPIPFKHNRLKNKRPALAHGRTDATSCCNLFTVATPDPLSL